MHRRLLEESINVSVFLCGDKCLLPPSFVTQCHIVRDALKAKKEFLAQSVIVLPLREKSLGDFFEKKILEYQSVKSVYQGLFEKEGQQFVAQFSHLVRKRHAEMGNTIAAKWEGGPDESRAWIPIKSALTNPQIQVVRSIPKRLKAEGKSVTWPAIAEHVDGSISRNSFLIDQALQYEYTLTYLQEYAATTISGLPIKQTNLCIAIEDLSYDCGALRAALEPIGLWNVIKSMQAVDLLLLRRTLGWFEFISAFGYSCRVHNDVFFLRHFFTFLSKHFAANANKIARSVHEILRLIGEDSPLSAEHIEFLGDVLLQVAHSCALHIGIAVDDEASASKGFTWLKVGLVMKKVFIVHGRNHQVRDQIDLFLRDLGLATVVMAAGAYGGRSLPEKFEEMAKCDFAVFLLTADDQLHDVTANKSIKRARQNVILEIGFFWGKIGRRGSVAFLVEDDPEMELPSDIQGIGWIPITKDLGETKNRLRAELSHAGIA